MTECRDPDGFARLRALELGAIDRRAPGPDRYRAALILAAKGGTLADITIGDSWSCSTPRPTVHGQPRRPPLFYRTLREMGIFGPSARTLRELRTAGHAPRRS